MSAREVLKKSNTLTETPCKAFSAFQKMPMFLKLPKELTFATFVAVLDFSRTAVEEKGFKR